MSDMGPEYRVRPRYDMYGSVRVYPKQRVLCIESVETDLVAMDFQAKAVTLLCQDAPIRTAYAVGDVGYPNCAYVDVMGERVGVRIWSLTEYQAKKIHMWFREGKYSECDAQWFYF